MLFYVLMLYIFVKLDAHVTLRPKAGGESIFAVWPVFFMLTSGSVEVHN